jgi:hypothetical protein
MADPWLIGICVAGLLAFWPGGTRFANSGAGDTFVAATAFLAFKVRCSTTPSDVTARDDIVSGRRGAVGIVDELVDFRAHVHGSARGR